MAGFVSVLGSSRGAGVVAPACLFVPFGSFALASAFARGVSSMGWRVWLRPGASGSPVFAACGLPVPAFAVKVVLPVGLPAHAARLVLSSVSPLSSLAALGI